MSDSNNNSDDNSVDLEALFFGGMSGSETSEDGEADHDEGVGLLQDIIVGPDMANLKRKVGVLETTCTEIVERQTELERRQAELENSMTQEQKQIAKLVFLKVSRLLEERLANLKAEIKTELLAELDNAQDLSIRVRAIQNE